jgi:ABC-type arginine transport system ATPase subunit
MTKKIYDDLNTYSIDNELVAQISKLIAELAKTGKINHLIYLGYSR